MATTNDIHTSPYPANAGLRFLLVEMATPIKRTPENRKTITSVSISGPAYMVAVGGTPRGSKPKIVLSRYLRPRIRSCHDLCKNGTNNESLEIKRCTRSSKSRKISVIKEKVIKTNVIPVERMKKSKTKLKTFPNPKTRAPADPNKVIKQRNSLPSKATVSGHGSSSNREATNKGQKIAKNRPTKVKRKSISSSTVNDSARLNSKKYENRIKTINNTRVNTQIRTKKTETPVLEFNNPAVETDQSQTLTIRVIELPNSESFKICEHVNDKEVKEQETCEDDYEMETIDGNLKNYIVVNCYGKDGEVNVKFKRGKIVELESDDDGPTRVKFRNAKVLDNESCNDSEGVTLKHQEMQEKEARELLNRMIEETASKLVVKRKTRVGALVGAFETVISRQDDTTTYSD
ncbi:uncharacterized protein [Rutidosis leptorrhynchoides]|uniref:uncharacterized protein n=1 Tax=Rutidosis leptorrhynchoides TaxID=125765 RepID=UPI003A9A095A